ncbi:C4-dicarboxylate ABC transporter [Gemmobacter tilapiae]|uniref:C4-dicarboxylate ABC transporter n=1 Tax=Neogemmobacter tilapiae TaxID=875041 RepID=A0A918TUI7_9RHOB|nr:C4-dicarboxylate ABC transporter [Gemmobacter tilapiae]
MESRQRRPQWAAFVIAAGLAAMALALLMDAAGQKQDGGYAGVGPGDVPRMVAYGLLVLSGLTVVAGFRGALPEPEVQNKGPVLWILTGLGLQLVLLHWAGFAIAGAMLFGLTARGFGKGPLWLTVGVGFLVALGIHGVFDGLLNLNLPAGPVERLVFGG